MSDQTQVDETRRLSAIMFTDIQGYSRMMQIDEHQTLKLLEEHNSILFPVIENKGGQIIKTVGDAILAVFDSCIAAVQSAIEIQESLAKRASDEESVTFRVRIGIHLGETVFKDNDVFGNGVNIAARLQPLADPGGICMSQAVFEQVQNHYGDKILRVGPTNLKNISEPVVIYRMQIEGITEISEDQTLKFKTALVEKGQKTKKEAPAYTTPEHAGLDNDDWQKIIAIFNETEKKGQWQAHNRIYVRGLCGECRIDFTDALLSSHHTEIRVKATFASVKIFIPQKYNVIVDGYGIAGEFKGENRENPSAEKTIKITGRAIMAEVKVIVDKKEDL